MLTYADALLAKVPDDLCDCKFLHCTGFLDYCITALLQFARY
jgi:hypothetical protein